ncbi:MAG TPA: DUF481 domain-containing protein [Gemmatimonadales bacterium]|nr:DUF481 domain-containing protein [Gemmatimonadales bacterium]
MHSRFTAVAAALIASALVSFRSLAAQQPDTASGLSITANVGLVDATGNTDLTTLSTIERADLRPAGSPWQLTQTFEWVFGNANGQTSANLLNLGGRAAYGISSRIQVFVGVAYGRDRFGGIARQFEEQAGVTLLALDTPVNRLQLEAGGAITRQRTTLGMDDNFVALRAAGDYVHYLAKSTYLEQSVELLPDVDDAADVRINSTSALVAPLSQRFALKVSYVIRFDNVPPPGFKKTDRVLTSGLQVTW